MSPLLTVRPGCGAGITTTAEQDDRFQALSLCRHAHTVLPREAAAALHPLGSQLNIPEGFSHMSERSTLRGSRLVATSYEDERGVEFAERQNIAYICTGGHRFEMTFSTEAEIPALWDCPRCGAEALRVATERPEDDPGKPARTHWDMLMERRSLDELQDLLDERLQLLRAGLLPGAAHLANNSRSRKKSA